MLTSLPLVVVALALAAPSHGSLPYRGPVDSVSGGEKTLAPPTNPGGSAPPVPGVSSVRRPPVRVPANSLCLTLVHANDGSPVHDAIVRVIWSDPESKRWAERISGPRCTALGEAAQTGDEGEVTFRVPSSARRWTVMVATTRWGAATVRSGTVADARQAITIPIRPGGTVQGVVRDEDGEPVFHAEVIAYHPDLFDEAGLPTTRTDVRGRYTLHHMPQRFTLMPWGGRCVVPFKVRGGVGSGGHVSGVDLVLADDYAVVRGRLLDEDGRPRVDVPVRWRRAGIEPAGRRGFVRDARNGGWARTGELGGFAIHLPPGDPVLVTWKTEGGRRERRRVAVDGEFVVLKP